MEWWPHIISGVTGLAAIISVWVSWSLTRAQVAKWERENHQKQSEIDLQNKEVTLKRAEDSKQWQAGFAAAEARERAGVERWQREFDAAKEERERQEMRWSKEFERGREQSEKQWTALQRQVLAQWKALRDRPMLDHRAHALIELYDSLCRIVTELKLAPMWKSLPAGKAAELGRKDFDPQVSTEYLNLISCMMIAAPYLPENLAEAIKHALAIIGRDFKALYGMRPSAEDPPAKQTDEQFVLDAIRVLGQLLNPRSPGTERPQHQNEKAQDRTK